MKLVRFLGVILTIAFIAAIVKYNENLSLEAMASSFQALSENASVKDSTIDYGRTEFSEDVKSDVKVITYTNNNSYPVYLSTDNIKIKCTGTGSTKIQDEEIASRGFKISAKFTLNKDGKKESRIEVPTRSTAYIYVTNEYVGTEYPENPVECDYSISIISA